MIISWLESTTAPFGQYWTSSASGETRAVTAGGTDNETFFTTEVGIDSFSYSANYSGTTKIVYVSTPYEATLYGNGSSYPHKSFKWSYVTHIGSVNSSEGGHSWGADSYEQTITIQQTRERQTSTTDTYVWGIDGVTQSVTASSVEWTTALNGSFTVFQSSPVYTTSSKYSAGLSDTTLTEEWTTTVGTEVYYGYDNTIYQCDTLRGDYLYENVAIVAWTAPNSFSLSEDAISAFTNVAQTATRWTESANVASLLASVANTAGSHVGPTTAKLTELTSEINYTTTTLETFEDAFDLGVFPLETQSVQRFRAATTSSVSSLTYYEAQTITTVGGFYNPYDAVVFIPKITTSEWFNRTTTYTTGNGEITWHAFTGHPTTRTRETQHITAGPGNQIPAALAPVVLYVPSIIWEGGFDDSHTEAAGISMTCPAYNSAGVTVGQGANVSWYAYGKSGSQIEQQDGGFVDLNLGKTFYQPYGLTAFAGRRAGLLKTVFPSTYSIADTNGEWSGLLSVHGKSASATFIPTNTDQSSTTTSAQFSTNFSEKTALASLRTGVIGGTPASEETFFEYWPRAIFANATGGTISATARVVSQTEASSTRYLRPIVGAVPAGWTQSRTIVSFTQARNQTALLY